MGREAVELVAEIYSRDFNMYDYDPEATNFSDIMSVRRALGMETAGAVEEKKLAVRPAKEVKLAARENKRRPGEEKERVALAKVGEAKRKAVGEKKRRAAEAKDKVGEEKRRRKEKRREAMAVGKEEQMKKRKGKQKQRDAKKGRQAVAATSATVVAHLPPRNASSA